MKRLNYFVAFIFLVSLQHCKNEEKKITIIPFELINYERTHIDRGETLHYKSDHFLLENYSEGEKADELIQKFVDENKDSNLAKFSQYDMVFYKESNKTNIHNIKENPRDLYRYSQIDDLLFDFTWTSGEFIRKYEYKSGKMIGTEDIIIKDIPDSMK